MPQIKPINDLENSKLYHTKKEPLFITKNNYKDFVIISSETYEKLIEIVKMDRAISESIEEFKNDNKLFDARESLLKLGRKYFR